MDVELYVHMKSYTNKDYNNNENNNDDDVDVNVNNENANDEIMFNISETMAYLDKQPL